MSWKIQHCLPESHLRLPAILRKAALMAVLVPLTLCAQLASFTARRDTQTSKGPISMAAADLNKDGSVDLAVVNSGSSTITLLKGNGTGFFKAAGTLTAGTNPLNVAIADLNGDGNADVVVANYGSGTTNVPGPGTISVFLGNGNLTFQPAVNYVAGTNPDTISVADVNGDGKLDLVVINKEVEGTVSVLLGNGDGTFQAPDKLFYRRKQSGVDYLGRFQRRWKARCSRRRQVRRGCLHPFG